MCLSRGAAAGKKHGFRVPRALLCAAIFALLSLPLQAASPAGLERLFTTAGERERLDRMRREGMGSGQRENAGVAASPVPRVKIDGVVMGSDGRRAVWANGRLRPAEDIVDGAGTRIRLAGDGRVAVKPAARRRPALLKAGQVLDLGSGRIHEAYETGAGGKESSDAARPPFSPGRKVLTGESP